MSVERKSEELDDQATEPGQDEAPVDGPGTGSQDDDLGDTSQDSPGRG